MITLPIWLLCWAYSKTSESYENTISHEVLAQMLA